MKIQYLVLLVVLIAVSQTLAQPRESRFPLSYPFDLENNQIFLKVGINLSEPVWFILDSGASANVIDAGLARKLKLKTGGEKQGTGAGKGTVRVTFAKDVTFTLPGLSTRAENSYVIDLSGQPALQGRQVGGILGYDFFVRYVVEVDYEARLITLHDPGSFKYSGKGQQIPFTLLKKTPHIHVKIKIPDREAVQREVLVDSGSGDALDDDVMAVSPTKLEVVGGVGLGQEFRTTVGRAESAQIGPYTLNQPVGVSGGVALIGNEVLRRFHVTYDYSRNVLFLEPNSHLQDEFLVDASGLDLRWSDDFKSFGIHDVAAQSPASEAGLRAGDQIITINGRPSQEFSIEQVGKLLSEDGKQCRLSVKRGSQSREVVLKLRKRL